MVVDRMINVHSHVHLSTWMIMTFKLVYVLLSLVMSHAGTSTPKYKCYFRMIEMHLSV
jgi:hypothetical protein